MAGLLLAGCTMPPVSPGPAPGADTPSAAAPAAQAFDIPRQPRAIQRAFVDVVDRVEPVAEAECRRVDPRRNCDFLIAVDDRPEVPANAFQTLNEDGRPVIVFTLGLIADARNRDELAFVMAHEAAHHIAGHIPRQRRNATLGALVFGQLAGATGGNVAEAQELGAALAARSYSKEFELEADRLGAIVAARAGFDPLRGADFFFRIPDPGDRFLGTHPANADRIAAVRAAVAGL
ncbi:M48 family metalloprotease [Salibaculum halophilum]|uniref:M48 family metalloprotease n=1 Tax=Salibaculum halophilum TaxID=1914408 RepID=UPI001FE9753C|nr:M48 family metalloprotease [Salibaculum halophilum]